MDALTRLTEWKKRTLQERLLERRSEFRHALEERMRLRRGRWGGIRMSLPEIMDDLEVTLIIQSTLDEERLLGQGLSLAMERVLNRVRTIERVPVELQGGLPERNRRKH